MAPQLKIHVDGNGSVFRTAERGVLGLNISSTSSSQDESSSNVQEATEALTKRFRGHAPKTLDGRPHPSAGITAFSASALRTTSFFPLDLKGQPRHDALRQHTAHATYEVVFRDLALLAETANELSSMPHVSIASTEWRLTAATRAEVEREARRKAMENAVQKAEDYAGVVGRVVVAVDIKDGAASYAAGGSAYPNPFGHGRQLAMMQQQQQQQQQQMQMGMAAPPAKTQNEGPAVEPRTITATAQVTVRFVSADGEPMQE